MVGETLIGTTQRIGEATSDYIDRFLKLSNRLRTTAEQCLTIFVNGLRPDLRLEVIQGKPVTFNEAMRLAKFAESILAIANPTVSAPKVQVAQHVNNINNDGLDAIVKSIETLSNRLQNLSTRFQSFEDEIKHEIKHNYDEIRDDVSKVTKTIENQQRPRYNGYNNNDYRGSNNYRQGGYAPRNIVCYNCGANDHYRSQCTRPPYSPGPSQTVTRKQPRGN